MYQQCQKQNIPISGNAANHSDVNGDWLDLTGEPRAPNPLPGGFTTKGYLGMAGCCVAAVMGMATIIWYGITDPEDKKAKKPFTITPVPQREENGGLVDQGTS
jgi:iron transport multicopper oxidase